MLKKILLIPIVLALSFSVWANYSFAANSLDWQVNTNLNSNATNNVKNDALNNLIDNSDNNFYWTSTKWAVWIKNTLVQIAKDIKNLFFILATIFFLLITLRLIFAENTEEDFWKYKKWIIWITVWLIVMQIAFYFVVAIYDKWAWATLADSLLSNVIKPLINLISTLASIFFLWIAIYTFIRLLSAWWNEEKIKNWKNSIIYALLWMLLVKFASTIVETIYWKYVCNISPLWVQECWIEKVKDLTWFSKVFLDLVNWLNWFVAIVTVLMILYAWALILFSWGDDEKLKKWKSIIIYALIWIFILVISYLILTFFIGPDWSNIVTNP